MLTAYHREKNGRMRVKIITCIHILEGIHNSHVLKYRAVFLSGQTK